MTIQFPDGFFFGTATAAYQIEGAFDADGRKDSIWDVFSRVPGAVVNGDNGDVACDHYHRYREDVALMAELGMSTYRFSVSWPRVMDGDRVNPAGMDFYSRLVDELLDHGIDPWLTLYHWDLPADLPGGWTSRDTAKKFVDYSLAMHERLGDRVRTWTTLNEPWCSAFLGYGNGEHAPGRKDPVEALTAAHHLLLAHGWTIQALRQADPTASLGITLNFSPALPASDDPADLDVVRRIDETFFRIFADPIFTGAYPAQLAADAHGWWPADLVHDGDLEAISAPIDVLGVNYYSTSMFTAGEPSSGGPHILAPDAVFVPRGLPVTEMGWEIDPGGLRDLLIMLQREYVGPADARLVITENGSAWAEEPDAAGFVDDTDTRLAYLRDHLRACHEAIVAGVDLRGYLTWSLIDNFEWSFGYGKKFGIVAMDAELNRTPKASAHWYAQVARTGQVR
jgi:beta-galactosidase